MNGARITHASRELIAAMLGSEPTLSVSDVTYEDLDAACGTADGMHDAYAYACNGSVGNEHTEDGQPVVVDCLACLAVMREARGGVRDDALQERESAAKSVLVNAEFDAERRAKSEAA